MLRERHLGFTLIELAVVLVITSLMIGFGLQAIQKPAGENCYDKTRLQLERIQSSVEKYVRMNNRYPKPASLKFGSDNAEFGKEVSTNTDITVVGTGAAEILMGALPTATIGLPVDYASDCWGSKFSYAVTRALTSNDASTGYPSDTVGGRIQIRGNTIATADTLSNEAAYAVVSHGEDKMGGTPLTTNNVSAARNCAINNSKIDTENCDFTNNVFFLSTFNNGKGTSNYFDDELAFAEKSASVTTKCNSGSVASWCSATNGGPCYATGCSGSLSTDLDSGSTRNLVYNNGGTSGSATVSCDNGVLVVQSGATCGLTCSGATLGWSGVASGCSATFGSLNSGQSSGSTPNTVANRTGNAIATCNGATGVSTASGTCVRDCAAQTKTWNTNCSAPVSAMNGGAAATITNDAPGYAGTATATCNGTTGDLDLTGTSCDATTVNCTSQPVSWGAGCLATAGAINDGATASATNTASGFTGSATVTCTHGTATASGTCNANCATQTVSWSTDCSANVSALAHGGSASATNSASGFTGTATMTCNNGVVESSGTTCNANAVLTGPGPVFCWGSNAYGQLGENTRVDSPIPRVITMPAGVTGFTSIYTRHNNSACAIANTGQPYCWGTGNIGNGTTSSNIPVGVTMPSGVTSFTALSMHFHTCGIGNNGRVYCWGPNNYGQLGDGTTTVRNVPTAVTMPSGVTSFTSVKVFSTTSCALADNGRLYCWGNNDYGQIGDASNAYRAVPTAAMLPSGVTSFTKFDLNATNTCAIGNNSKLYCWGRGDQYYGTVAHGTAATVSIPTAATFPSGVTAFTEVSMGLVHACAIGNNGAAYCWGYSGYGEMGNGTTNFNYSPTLVTFPSGVTAFSAIQAKPYMTCAHGNNNRDYCWGRNTTGQLGIGSKGTDRLVPTIVPLPNGVASFSTMALSPDYSSGYGCAVGNNGKAYCWGTNSVGQLGDGTNTERLVASATEGDLAFQKIDTATAFVCGIARPQAANCTARSISWGSNCEGAVPSLLSGQATSISNTASGFGGAATATCDNGTVTITGATCGAPVSCPVQTVTWGSGCSASTSSTLAHQATRSVTNTAADRSGTATVTCNNGTAVASGSCNLSCPAQTLTWLANCSASVGAIAHGASSIISNSTPTYIGTVNATCSNGILNTFGSSCNYNAAVGDLYCWGYGALGTGPYAAGTAHVPTRVTMPSGVASLSSVVAGDNSSSACAIGSNGRAYCWGANDYGNIGAAIAEGTSAPTPVGVTMPSGVTSFTTLAAGSTHYCGMGNNARIYCWGRNNYGQIGDGTSTNRNVPTAVALPGGVTSFTELFSAPDSNNTCATGNNARLYCWGHNASGQVGDGSTVDRQSPSIVTLPSGVTAFSGIHMVGDRTCAMGNNNRIYCWGNGTSGGLGNGASSNSSVPVPVTLPSGVTSFTAVDMGNSHACALGNDAQVYCWGNGYVGNGTGVTTTNVPVAITRPSGITGFTKLHIGNYNYNQTSSCATANTGRMYCWASRSGDGTPGQNTLPSALTLPDGVNSFSAINQNNGTICTIGDNGRVYCWGDYTGNGTGSSSLIPTPVTMPNGVNAFSRLMPQGGGLNCAIASSGCSGQTVSWGGGCSATNNGYLSTGATATVSSSAAGFIGNAIVTCQQGTLNVAGQSCSAASTRAYCWGTTPGNNTSSSNVPIQATLPSGVTSFTSIASTSSTACAIADNGRVYCWGSSANGLLGNGGATSGQVPAGVTMPSGVTSFTALRMYTVLNTACAMGNNARVYCWGDGQYGQMGNGGTGSSNVPVAVSLPSGVTSFTALSENNTCATGNDNKLYCWGWNVYGRLGVSSSTTAITTPTLVTLPSGVTAFSSVSTMNNAYATCAIGDNGRAYCWGQSDGGILGNGNSTGSTNAATAVTMPSGVTSFSTLGASQGYVCAIGNNAKIYCWGRYYDTYANQLFQSNVPIEAPNQNSNTFAALSFGVHYCGLDTKGKTYCWGNNYQGNSGNGSNGDTANGSETILPTGVKFTSIKTAGNFNCAMGDNARVYCWGQGFAGNNTGDTINNRPVEATKPADVRDFSSIVADRSLSCALGTSIPATCPAQTIGWGTNCAASVGGYTNGQTATIANTASGYVGSSEVTCTGGVLNVASTHCDATGAVTCAAQTVTWNSNCSASTSTRMAHGQSAPYTNSALGYTGRATLTCTNGTLSSSATSCATASNCSTQSVTWGNGCAATISGINHNGTSSVTNNNAGYMGNATALCNDGVFEVSLPNCEATNGEGNAYCWGLNTVGQLADGTLPNYTVPNPVILPLGVTSFTSVVRGYNMSCGIGNNGLAYCWGQNDYGMLGGGTTGDSPTPIQVTLPSGVTSFTSLHLNGSSHACGIGNNGRAYCWGYNAYGQLGNGTTTNSNVPVPVTLPSGVTSFTGLQSTGYLTCAIGNNGRAYCWGLNSQGMIGDGTTTDRNVPTPVTLPSGVTSFSGLSIGINNTCAIGNNNRAYCWGMNNFGQVGKGSIYSYTDYDYEGNPYEVYPPETTPQQVILPSGVSSYSSVQAGYYANCGMGNNNRIYCWGYNLYGQLGTGSGASQNHTPEAILLPSGVSSFSSYRIAYAGLFGCALGNNNLAYCWGLGHLGQSGTGTLNNPDRPTAVTLPAGVTSFSNLTTYQNNGCARGNNNVEYCWGYNNAGQVGNGTKVNTNVPVPITMPSGVTSFSGLVAPGDYNCALGSNGRAYCWGANQYGKLGLGLPAGSTPVAAALPAGVTSFVDFSTGNSHSCGIGNNGRAYCWGSNSNGQLGNGLTLDSVSPIAVALPSGVSYFRKITASGSHTCALANTGRVYCWGTGYLGNNTYNVNALPVPVSRVSDAESFTSISAGQGSFTCGIANNGKAYCWGSLGPVLGNNVNTASPAQIPAQVTLPSGVTGFTAIASGGAQVCAIANTGAAYCWGYGSGGNFGNGSTTSQSAVPVLVTLPSGVTSFTNITSGSSHSCAIANTGASYCWGTNTNGAIGNGTTTNALVPTAVNLPSGVTAFRTLSAGGIHTCGTANTGAVYCWGYNAQSQLGNGTAVNSTVPVPLTMPVGISHLGNLSTNYSHSCAIASPMPVGCSAQNVTWGTDCIAASTGMTHGQVATLTNIGTNPGTTTARCFNGRLELTGASCTPVASGSCRAQAVSWSTHCTATTTNLADGASTTIGSTAVGYSGNASLSCAGGVLTTTGQTCANFIPGCSAQTLTWGTNCTASVGVMSHGDSTQVASSAAGYSGLATANCSNATLTAGLGSSCAAVNANEGELYCWGGNDFGNLGDGPIPTAYLYNPVFMPSGITSYTALSNGTYVSCALANNGRAYCWGGTGSNGYLSLGDGQTRGSDTPVAVSLPSGVTSFTAINAGTETACALGNNGRVYCWGNSSAALGNGTSTESLVPLPVNLPSGVTSFTAIATGSSYGYMCAIGNNGRAYCWGGNASGELGDGTTNSSNVPVAVTLPSGVTSFTSIMTGRNTTCAVANTSQLYCWGAAYLGNNTTSSSTVPVAVTLPSGVTSFSKPIANLYGGACAIANTGRPYCWGQNDYGSLGNGSAYNATSNIPVGITMPSGVTSFTSLGAGYRNICGIANTGAAYCWGYLSNSPNLMPEASSGGSSNIPITVPYPSGVTSFSAVSGMLATGCALADTGKIYCWGGYYVNDALGLGRTALTPRKSIMPSGVTAFRGLSTNSNHTCAIGSNNRAYCWGQNTSGKLGNGTTTDTGTPTPVTLPSGVTGFTQVTVGYDQSCGIANTGASYCWGANSQGQIGNGTTTASSVPVAITLPSGVTSFTLLAAGVQNTCGIANTGLPYCWGTNGSGQLGNGTTTSSNVPVAVTMPSGTTSFSWITSNGSTTCGIANTGRAYCWGDSGGVGKIGDGTTSARSLPTLVTLPSGVTSFTTILTSYTNTCALGNNGRAYCWGHGAYSQIGDGTTNQSSVPVAVTLPSGVTSFTTLSHGGEAESCAKGNNGQLYCWGRNAYGNLGNGTKTPSNVPVAVTTPSNVAGFSSITTGPYNTCAVAPPAPANCTSQTVTWSGSCSASVSALNSGQSTTANSSNSFTGSATISCTNGVLSAYGTTCNPPTGGCAAGTTVWSSNCRANNIPMANNATASVTNSASGYTGSATFTCTNGTVNASATVCNQIMAACSAQTLTWGTNCTASVGAMLSGDRTPVSSSASGYNGTANASCYNGTITAGLGSSCAAAVPVGGLYCWGDNYYGQAGDGTGTDKTLPNSITLPTGVTSMTSVTTGGQHSCGIGNNGRAYCWGHGAMGQLGNGGIVDSQAPVAVTLPSGVTSFTSVTAGQYHSCGIGNNNVAYCWGYNDFGRLGDGTTTQSSVPVVVTLPSGVTSFTSISAAVWHTCGIGNNGRAYCWGRSNYGQLGNGSTTDSAVPVAVQLPSGVSTFTSIHAGYGTSCAIGNNARAYCWGYNGYGTLADGTYNDSATPLAIPLPSGVTSFTAASPSSTHSCFLANTGRIYCLGGGSNGELGNSASAFSANLVAVTLPSGVTSFTSIMTGSQTSCAFGNNSQLYCWGVGGQVGDGTIVARNAPVAVTLPSGVTSFTNVHLSGVAAHSCAIGNNGKTYCWGSGTQGQLGQPIRTLVPTRVTMPTGVTSFTAVSSNGNHHNCAIGNNGRAYCWGYNYWGQAGVGATPAQANVPMAVTLPNGVTSFTSISVGAVHTCGLGNNGRAYCWGHSGSGKLGTSASPTNVPVLVDLPAGETSFTAVSAANDGGHSCGIGNTGAGYCWGAGGEGEIGDGTYSTRYTPTAVTMPSGVTFTSIGAGMYHSCALGSNGRVYCWGLGSNFELGVGNHDNQPKTIPTLTGLGSGASSFTQLSVGSRHNCAIGDNGRAYCWGTGFYGQLGNNSTSNSGVPLAVTLPSGATSFTSVTAGKDHSCGMGNNGKAYCWGSAAYYNLGNGGVTQSNVPVAVTLPSVDTTFSYVAATGRGACAIGTGPLPVANCSAQTVNWSSGCSASVDALDHGATAPATSTGSFTGNATISCNNGVLSAFGTSCTAPTGACASALVTWNGSCSKYVNGMVNGATAPLTNTDPAYNGTATLTCTNGTFATSAATCAALPVNCAAQSITWGNNCSATTTSLAHNATGNVSNSVAGYNGTANLICSDGVVSVTSSGCGTPPAAEAAQGAMYCWGFNVHGQLGNNSSSDRLTPVAVTVPSGVTSFGSASTGAYHSCAIANTGNAYCWGSAGYGVLGENASTERRTPVLVNLPSGVTSYSKIASGWYHNCAIGSNSRVYCWGSNDYSQLGNGGTTESAAPVLYSGNTTYTAVTAGMHHSCALTSHGMAYCWGRNDNSQLGNSGSLPSGVTSYVSISAGDTHTCALANTGRAYCWGFNQYGELGNGNQTQSTNALVALPSGVTSYLAVVTGRMHSCGLGNNNRVYCWGLGDSGQMGNGSTSGANLSPVAVNLPSGVTGFTSISTAGRRVCAVANTGTTYCWGENVYGGLGNNSTTSSSVPVAVTLPSGVAGFSVLSGNTGYHTCAIATTGCSAQTVSWGTANCSADIARLENGGSMLYMSNKLGTNGTATISCTNNAVTVTGGTCDTIPQKAYCSGNNYNFQLGNGSGSSSATPVAVYTAGGLPTAYQSVGVGYKHACGIAANNQIYCWGGIDHYDDGETQYSYTQGQLGNNVGYSPGTYYTTPVMAMLPATGATSWKQLSVGGEYSCAIGNNDQLYCWGVGANPTGIGTGNGASVLRPTLVALPSGVTSWKKVVASSSNGSSIPTCAIANTNDIYCWGAQTSTYSPATGYTTSNNPTNPATKPAGVTAWKDVSGASSHICALDTNSRLYCTGNNMYGQLGLGNTINAAVWTQVLFPTGVTGFTQVEVSSLKTCALGNNGRAYCWGYNNYGQLGDGTATNRSAPTIVTLPSGVTSFAKLASRDSSSTCAIANTGRLYCWGYNAYGHFGNGSSSTSYTPVLTNLPSGMVSMTDTGVSFYSQFSCMLAKPTPTDCTAQTVTWRTNCSASVGVLTHGQSVSAPNTGGGFNGSATITCNNGTLESSVTSCSLIPGSCSAQNVAWNTNCNANVGNMSNGADATLTNTANGYVGSATVSCANGILSKSGTSCGAQAVGCAPQTVTWNTNCTASTGLMTDGGTATVGNATIGYSGNTSVSCSNGVLTAFGSTCAADAPSGASFCWGHNGGGLYFGNNVASTTNTVPLPTTMPAGVGFTNGSIENGQQHSCALGTNGRIYCWGNNGYGNLGDGTTTSRTAPVMTLLPSGVTSFTAVSTGTYLTCGLANTGNIYCWGYGEYGQTGPNPAQTCTYDYDTGETYCADNGPNPTPRLISLPSGVTSFTSVMAEHYYACGIGNNGRAYCWGYNANGQLGDGTTSNRSSPAAVQLPSGVTSFKSIDGGTYANCAIGNNDRAYCWGYNASGQLGAGTTGGTTNAPDTPVALPSGVTGFTSVKGGWNHSCGMGNNGRAYCWGYNAYGMLGNGTSTTSNVPVVVNQPARTTAFISVEPASESTCGVANDARTYCWGRGDNGYGKIGTTYSTNVPTLVPLPAGNSVNTMTSATSDYYHSCAISPSCGAQTVRWGSYCSFAHSGSKNGVVTNLSDTEGSATGTATATCANGILTVTNPVCSAPNPSGRAYCWGSNDYGQLGDGMGSDRPDPYAVVLPSGTTGYRSISASSGHTCAIADTGRAYCWGYNEYGALGNGTTSPSYYDEDLGYYVAPKNPTPVPVTLPSGVTSFIEVASGSTHSCGIGNNNTTYCWGYNGSGQLADGTLVNRTTAVPVTLPSSVTSFSKLTAGQYHTCAIANTGRIYCWGYNSAGQLGDNSVTTRNTPVAVTLPSGVTTFTAVSAAMDHTCALGNNARAYCWGQGSEFRLGNGSTSSSSVPVTVTLPSGVTSYTSIMTSQYINCAIANTGQPYCWGNNSQYCQANNGACGNLPTPTAQNMPSGVTTYASLVGTIRSIHGLGNNNVFYSSAGVFTPQTMPAIVPYFAMYTASRNHLCGIFPE